MRAALLVAATAASLLSIAVPSTTSAQRTQVEARTTAAGQSQPGGLPAQVPVDTRTDALRYNPGIRRSRRPKTAGPGWSNRHVQRTAAKARNVKRSKGKR